MAITSISPNSGVGGDPFTIIGTDFNALYANNATVEVKALLSITYQWTAETRTYGYNVSGSHTNTTISCVAPNYNGRGTMSFSVFQNNNIVGTFAYSYPNSTVTSCSLDTNSVLTPGSSTITVNGTNLQYLTLNLIYFLGMMTLGTPTVTGITYNGDYSQLSFTLPYDPYVTQSHGIRLMIGTGGGYGYNSTENLYNHAITYPSPTIQSIVPAGGTTYGGWYGNNSFNTITIYGQNLWGMGYAKVGSESCNVVSISPDGTQMVIFKPTGNLNGSSSGYVSIGTASSNILVTGTQWYPCILTPFIDSFYPQSGPAGTTVDIYGYNLVRNNPQWVVPSVTFNGVPAVVDTNFNGGGHIRVTAPLSYTGRIVVTNNVTGSHTSAIDYTYPPVAINVNFSTNIMGGGGSITSIQYSKNGGAWTTMGRGTNIYNTDYMQYRATFTKASGYNYMDVQITVPPVGNCMNDSSSTSPITRSTWGSFRSLSSYTVYFGVNSYGTGGGGGIH